MNRMCRALGLASILAVVTTTGSTALAGGSQATCLRSTAALGCEPRLAFDLGASIVPKKLPRNEPTPVGLEFQGTIGHDDGSHPSALREMVIDIDKDVAIDATGLPTCKGSLLRVRNVRGARRACRDSIVGNGTAHVAIASAPEPIPTILTLFNGGVSDSKRFLYIHSFIATPTRAAIVTTVEIEKTPSGLYAVAKIPVVADGNGSVVDFSFTIKRLFTHRNTEKSYLQAKCPDGVLKVNVPMVRFRNEALTPGVAATTVLKGGVAVPCTPAG